MSPLERRCRHLLRAWPWRDRWERGDELVGTMLDVIGDGRQWPPPGLVVDMVVGGISARRRRRPPLATYLRFIQGGRVEYRWHEWMLDRMLAPGWRRRLVVSAALHGFVVQLGLLLVLFPVVPRDDWVIPLFFLYVSLSPLFGCLRPERKRSSILRDHGYSVEGSPPQVVSHLVWSEKPSSTVNVRLAPVMAAASIPLLGAGVLAIVDRSAGSNVPAFTRLHVPVLAVVAFVLGLLAAVAIRAYRVPRSPGHPAAWTVPVAVFVAVGIVSVETVLLHELPSVAWAFVGGVVGIAMSLVAGVLFLREWRIGRPIGIWDLHPQLGPGIVPVRPPVWLTEEWSTLEGDRHKAS